MHVKWHMLAVIVAIVMLAGMALAEQPKSVTGDVNVVNQPTVNLAPGTTVNIGNAPAVGTPFHTSVSAGITSDAQIGRGDLSPLIPDGKRFVIESVSAEIGGFGDGFNIQFETLLGINRKRHFLTVSFQGVTSSGIKTYTAGTQSTKIYADASDANSQDVICSREVPSGGTASCTVTFSGYLIDLP